MPLYIGPDTIERRNFQAINKESIWKGIPFNVKVFILRSLVEEVSLLS